MSWSKQYRGLKHSISVYWNSYGGFSALVKSPYFHISTIFATIATVIHYFVPSWYWYDLAQTIIPDLLGFSLGGYAVFLTFGNTKFMKVLTGPSDEGEPSPFMKANGAFVHFILLQAITLLYGIFFKVLGVNHFFVSFFGYLLLFYSLTSLIAATFAILNFSNEFDQNIHYFDHNKTK